MKKFSIGAFALAATMTVSAPAFAAGHGHHKAHKGTMHQKADKGSASTEDLNARSLEQARTPVPATAPASAPSAVPTVPTASGAVPPSAGTVPSNVPAAAPVPPSSVPANAPPAGE